MSESELEYRSGALKLERRLHNIGQFIQFKAFRVARTPARHCTDISRESINRCVRDGATIIRNYVGKSIFDIRRLSRFPRGERSTRALCYSPYFIPRLM